MGKNKKDAYYFKHDSNARNDVKVLRLRREMKIEGYGIYFMLLEVLRDQSDHRFPLASLTDLAYDFRIKEEVIAKVIGSFDLFIVEDGYFYSPRLSSSMDDLAHKKVAKSEAGKRGNAVRWGSDNKKMII